MATLQEALELEWTYRVVPNLFEMKGPLHSLTYQSVNEVNAREWHDPRHFSSAEAILERAEAKGYQQHFNQFNAKCPSMKGDLSNTSQRLPQCLFCT